MSTYFLISYGLVNYWHLKLDHPVYFGVFPAEISSKADEGLSNLLPEKSKERYQIEFDCLEAGIAKNSVNIISDTVLLAYFNVMVYLIVLNY